MHNIYFIAFLSLIGLTKMVPLPLSITKLAERGHTALATTQIKRALLQKRCRP
jgi:hypothetical protein